MKLQSVKRFCCKHFKNCFFCNMQDIEPYFNWRHLYVSEEDDCSPFYQREYSEFEYSNKVYNYFIHPQWDEFGSNTLYCKILFVDYVDAFAIVELLGEWNDAINNDVMWLKREVADVLIAAGIDKFILIGENVLNFHASDDCYYEEWFQDLDEGWITALNFQDHVLGEFKRGNIDYYFNFGGELDNIAWRRFSPVQLFSVVKQCITRRLY